MGIIYGRIGICLLRKGMWQLGRVEPELRVFNTLTHIHRSPLRISGNLPHDNVRRLNYLENYIITATRFERLSQQSFQKSNHRLRYFIIYANVSSIHNDRRTDAHL